VCSTYSGDRVRPKVTLAGRELVVLVGEGVELAVRADEAQTVVHGALQTT